MAKKELYKDWIVRYYANHNDIPPGHTDGELTELIRCKDCKHCMIFSIYKTKWYVCTRNVESIDVEAEDFCSNAERGNNERV